MKLQGVGRGQNRKLCRRHMYMPCPPISLSYQLLFGESPPHPTVDRGRHVSMFPYPDGLRVVGESCHVDDLGGVVHHGVDPGDLEEKKKYRNISV